MQEQSKEKNKQGYGAFLLTRHALIYIWGIIALFVIISCNSSAGSADMMQQPPQVLPVLTLTPVPATTYQEFSASLEGSGDIEIRPQVDGYLDRIYVDEGAHVRKGQALFHISDRPFREQLHNAQASLAAAKANLANAEINVSKLTPLVQNNIVSEVQLKTAKASYDAAVANVAQAQAMVQSAMVNIGFATVTSPVDGYIGRIPYKTGSLVGMSTPQPLTVVSAIRDVYAYFSFSEKDFLVFAAEFSGNTIEEKIKHLPPVDLILADNTLYPHKGRVQTVAGQFNNEIGTISFRATFPNAGGLLRSGNTGKIRIPHSVASALVVPQEATFELQDKVFVFVVGDSNKVVSVPLQISSKTPNYYVVEKGLKAGDKIVYTGLDRLRDGAFIQPEALSLDSILKVKPL